MQNIMLKLCVPIPKKMFMECNRRKQVLPCPLPAKHGSFLFFLFFQLAGQLGQVGQRVSPHLGEACSKEPGFAKQELLQQMEDVSVKEVRVEHAVP